MKHTFVSKTDLAVAFFPHINEHSARHKLMNYIESTPELMQQLHLSGYTRLSRSFSPKQVEMICEVLGNPWK